MNRLTAALALALTALSVASAGASAATFVVTSMADSGAGTLRAAMIEANASPGADIITIHPALSGIITVLSPIIATGSFSIIGPGPGTLIISGNGTVVPFRLQENVQELGLTDLIFQDCTAAIEFDSQLRLNIHRCTFRDNGNSIIHAGVFSQSFDTNIHGVSGIIQSCTFLNNRGAYGGVSIGLPPASGLTLDIINCTFHGNSSLRQGGVWTIYSTNTNTGVMRIINSTITGSTGGLSTGVGFGAIQQFAGPNPNQETLRVRNSIIAENTPGLPGVNANFSGFAPSHLIFEGANIFSDPNLTPPSPMNGQIVRAPMPGSPAIDAALADPTVLADQLGTPRPLIAAGAVLPPGSDGADIGAVEFIPSVCPADFDHSGTVSVPDIFAFLSAWFEGCP